MNAAASAVAEEVPNGSGAAAILAAGVGALVLAVLAIATDRVRPLQRLMTFSKPTGPLSGVTTSAVVIWLVTWAVLDWRWRKKTLATRRIGVLAVGLLVLALLLTFPPLADLF